MKHSNTLSRSTVVFAVSLVAAGFFTQSAMAEEVSAYKIPPMEVSSETSYKYQFINILGSKMAYVAKGEGDPILFLHGQPTSSYIWRNIMPLLEGQGRVIAPDNIGFGQSDKPDLDYVFEDHYRYIEGFINALELKNITLVVHDWGSALGLNYAAQNPGNVKAIVTMESIIAPFMPAKSYESMGEEMSGFFRTARDPVKGPKMLIDDNYFIEEFLPGFISRPLDKTAHDVYRQPFLEKSSRKPVNQWPNELPIGGVPATTYKIVSDYNAFLETTKIPWLFLYASPGALNTPAAAEYWAERAQNIETVYIGAGLHYVQEDQPYAIGRAISDWYRRLN